jgi:aromatic-L-amino-acid/L-tryptophan decarboxylase
MAQEFAAQVASDDRFELVAPHPLALVTFRLCAGDDATTALLERANATGRVFLTHTQVNGAVAIRMAVGAVRTEPRHVEQAWRLLAGLA